jgi:hypothetical protein
MSKILAIGDIHGRTLWKQIIEQDYDKVIFVGDYVDTHGHITGPEQFNNLHDIIDFKLEQPDKVELLIGNHDYHYWPGITETCSGYQVGMKNAFSATFEKYKDLFKMCHIEEGMVFSHAGFTDQFIDSMRVRILPDHINGLFKVAPQIFGYYSADTSGYGDHALQSNIWVRPGKLKNWAYKMTQVVGHTYQQGINIEQGKANGLYFIDALEKSESLIIEDGEPRLQITMV